MDLPLLYSNRSPEDQNFIKEVCNYILSSSIQEKPESNDFAAIFVEGRNRQLNCLEDVASIMSFKRFSKYNYPVFIFCNNSDNLLHSNKLGQAWLDFHRINIIKIPEINSLEEYSKFMIGELFFRIPENIKHCLTLQADGFLLKSGYEDWLLNNNFDLIGAKWMHQTQLQVIDGIQTLRMSFPPVSGCNLGFSYRRPHKMRAISNNFSMLNLNQVGDVNCPEDAFYSYLGFGSKICKLPTRYEMDQFSIDPLDKEAFLSKRSIGFHFFKKSP